MIFVQIKTGVNRNHVKIMQCAPIEQMTLNVCVRLVSSERSVKVCVVFVSPTSCLSDYTQSIETVVGPTILNIHESSTTTLRHGFTNVQPVFNYADAFPHQYVGQI